MAGVFKVLGLPPATGVVVVGFVAGTALGALFAPLILLGAPVIISGLLIYPTLIAKPGSRYIVATKEDRNTVSSTFARAAYFVLVEDGKVLEEIKNPYTEALPAGPPAVELATSRNVDEVVAGSFGRPTLEDLHKRGIKPIYYEGTVEELLTKSSNKEISDLLAAHYSVESWGVPCLTTLSTFMGRPFPRTYEEKVDLIRAAYGRIGEEPKEYVY